MTSHQLHIQQKLSEREANNALRTLTLNHHLIDFCSNDYLGLAKEKLIHSIDGENQSYGSTGSRLISGNHTITEEVEKFLANYYDSETALLFNSGYNANLGLFSCLPLRGDTIIYDELSHASIRDGIKLSNAHSFSFKHNSVEDLIKKIAHAKGNIYVVVESIYSMDGDAAPMEQISAVCESNNAAFIVDEAHAVGTMKNGKGLCVYKDLQNKVLARVVTFGKALGGHGAAVLCNRDLRNYLINFSRPFIYTTALPITNVVTIRRAHEFLQENKNRIDELEVNISYFKSKFKQCLLPLIESDSPIQSVLVEGNDKVKNLSDKLLASKIDVRPILSPTVPKGKERLRICLHSFNTQEQIDALINTLKN